MVYQHNCLIPKFSESATLLVLQRIFQKAHHGVALVANYLQKAHFCCVTDGHLTICSESGLVDLAI